MVDATTKTTTKRKIASNKQALEHYCVYLLPLRIWRRSILRVRGDHCVGDWSNFRLHPLIRYKTATVCLLVISAHQMILSLGLKPSGEYRSG